MAAGEKGIVIMTDLHDTEPAGDQGDITITIRGHTAAKMLNARSSEARAREEAIGQLGQKLDAIDTAVAHRTQEHERLAEALRNEFTQIRYEISQIRDGLAALRDDTNRRDLDVARELGELRDRLERLVNPPREATAGHTNPEPSPAPPGQPRRNGLLPDGWKMNLWAAAGATVALATGAALWIYA